MSNPTVKAMAERRVRRQKIFIAVGSVALLAILGFELPKILGGHGGSGTIEAVTTISPADIPPVVPVGTLPNTDRVVVVRGSNQLISFGLFKSKDPFVQQLTTAATPTTAAPPASTPSASTPPTGTAPSSGGSAPVVAPPPSTTPAGSPSVTPATTTPGTTTPATTPPPVPTAALISTNGVCEQVSVKGTFPASENIFRLVSIAKDGTSVQIGIVGGAFDSGEPTATLKVGEKITLVNTADGTRYVIKLESKCSTVAAPSGTTASQAPQAPTAPIAPTPTTTETTTTTSTTPIVTDSLDTSTPTG